VPNRSTLVRASYTFGGGDAPHERPPRRQMHDAGEVESRAHGEDSVEWAGDRREGVLTPAVTGSLAWAASFSGAAASTAMESGAVKESVPSVLHSCRMSTKNASKTQSLAVFQQSTSTDNNPYLLPRSVLPPYLGYVGCTLSRRQGCMDGVSANVLYRFGQIIVQNSRREGLPLIWRQRNINFPEEMEK
jgi:hypothetical protein